MTNKRTRPFDLSEAIAGAKCVTRDGRTVKEVRHFVTAAPAMRVVALIDHGGGSQSLVTYYEDGRKFQSEPTDDDLVMYVKPKERKPHFHAIVLNQGRYELTPELYRNEADAKKFCGSSYVHLVIDRFYDLEPLGEEE